MAGMTVLLLLLWAGVTLSSPVDLQKRIVGGKTCDSAERKYHVYVQGFNGTVPYMCGGSIIHEDWVLTAAHCYQGKIDLHLGVHPGRLNLQSGGVKFINYEIYKKSVRSHDLMLVKLPTPSSVTPIQLPTAAECANQAQIKEIEVAGYAATTLGGKDRPSELQCGKIGLLSAQECTKLKNHWKKCTDPDVKTLGHSDILCFLSSSVATQPGDSGGGVVHNGKLYGVIVMGYGTLGCTYPSYAMNLCNKDYRKWINDTIYGQSVIKIN